MRVWAGFVAVVVVLAVAAGAGAASVAAPSVSAVNAAVRASDLRLQRSVEGSRLTCSWSAGTLTYQCLVWKESQSATGTVVNGVAATVVRRRQVQACGSVWPAGSRTLGCRSVTAKPVCLYAVSTTLGLAAVRTVVMNMCRAGWQKRL